MSKAICIEVFSDVICPWCLIGYHRLETALSLAQGIAVDVTWLPFELNPDMPKAGMDRRAYLEAKFGKRGADEVYGRIAHVMDAEGLEADLGKISRTPNTFDAHRLIHLAKPTGHSHELKLALLRAYFVDGLDIGDPATLASCAEQVGLEAAEVLQWLMSNAGEKEVRALEENARQIGVTGVPFFIFEGTFAISGAQPPEILLKALDKASALAA